MASVERLVRGRPNISNAIWQQHAIGSTGGPPIHGVSSKDLSLLELAWAGAEVVRSFS